MKNGERMTRTNPTLSKGDYKKIFAESVKILMEIKYKASSNKPKALAKDAGISLSSVQRAISGETAPNLDTVEAIVNALGSNPAAMLQKESTSLHNVAGQTTSPRVKTMSIGKIVVPSKNRKENNQK